MTGHATRWMALLVLLGLLGFPSLAAFGQSASTLTVPVSQWSQDLAVQDDVAYGVTVDDRGAAIVVGTSGIVKYARSGELVWTASYGGTAFDVATDRLLDVMVAGAQGLAKYSSSGQRLWTIDGTYHGVAVASEDRIVALGEDEIRVIDPSGSILGTLAYPGTPTAVATDDSGDRAIVVGDAGLAAYSPIEQTRRWRGDSPQDARDVALTSDGEILAASASGVVKYGPRGHRQWRVPFLGEARAVTPVPVRQPLQAEPGASGDALLVSGHHPSGGDSDYLVAKYDAEGNLLWNVREDGDYGGDDFAHDVAAGSDNRLYVTGTSTRRSRDSRSDQALSQDYYTIQYAEQSLPETDQGTCGADARPTADFAMSPEAPRAGQAVQFRDRSSDADGYIMSWHWDFGDGTKRRSQAPRHSFARNARYTVALTVVDNDFCTATVEREIDIGGSSEEQPGERAPEGFDWTVEAQGELDADFDWTTSRETRGTYPRGFAPSSPTDVDTIQFRDQSISGSSGVTVHFNGDPVDPNDSVVQWQWDFGDGATSSRANPTHTYDQTGRYVVTLTVTTADDATRTHEATLDLRDVGGAPITAYRWSFGDGASSQAANPPHDYGDDGTYQVTLNVRDAQGNSDTATKTIDVRNVPPVARFDWAFEGFPEGLPPCPTGGEELPPMSYRLMQGEIGGSPFSCEEPTMPVNAGPLALVDRSQDGEPRQELVSRSWAFEGAEAVCAPSEGGDETSCFTDQRTTVLFPTSTSEERLTFLYRGPVTVDLTVQDDDGATSTRSSTIEVANIPPYAMFEWSLGEPFPAPSVLDSPRSSASEGPVPHQFGGESTTACESCAGIYGTGEPQKSATSMGGNLTVTRTIRSDSCGFEGAPSAICGVRSEFVVDVTVEATDISSVSVEETFPSGWSASSCFAEGISCEGSQVSGTVSFEGSGTSTRTFTYELDPQWWRGSSVSFGAHSIQGTFTENGEISGESVSLSNQVILCDQVNAAPTVNFHGLDAEDVESRFRGFPLDPNGDEIVAYDWTFGMLGTGNGQNPSGGPCTFGDCQFDLTDLTCSYTSTEFESGWSWSYDLNVDLTVTDEGGASTTTSTTVPLGGPCGEEVVPQ